MLSVSGKLGMGDVINSGGFSEHAPVLNSEALKGMLQSSVYPDLKLK
jgi:hypothetical protein